MMGGEGGITGGVAAVGSGGCGLYNDGPVGDGV